MPLFPFRAVNAGRNIFTIDLDDEQRMLSLHDIVRWLDDPKNRLRSYQALETYVEKSLILVPGTDVELSDGTFFRIKFIVSEQGSTFEERIRLYGHTFILTGSQAQSVGKRSITHHQDSEDLCHLLFPYPNEVCWVANSWECINEKPEVQEYKAIEPSQILDVVTIKITNQLYPRLNTLVEEGKFNGGARQWYRNYPLVCRYKATRRWPSLEKAKQGCFRHCTKTIERFRQDDTDYKCGISDLSLMRSYRPQMVPGGDHFGVHHSERQRREWEASQQLKAIGMQNDQGIDSQLLETGLARLNKLLWRGGQASNQFEVIDTEMIIDVDDDNEDPYWDLTSKLSEGLLVDLWKQRYSFGDMFAGAGGVSRAAVLAGLAPRYMVDMDAACCSTYFLNFPGTKVACNDVFKFIWDPKYEKTIDILHMSNPCQPFARCHTVDSPERDRVNRECLATIEEMLRKSKPRVVTIENSDGLYAVHKHREFFDSLMTQFLSEGYSIQVKVVNFANYGVPQNRYRMIVIATCPGQRLPGFPELTHEKDGLGGRKPCATINSALEAIPWPWTDHNPENMRIFEGEPWDGNKLAQTLVCSNSAKHPDGFRNYTTRELASLQTFPLYHEFGPGLRDRVKEKQIGNAVPPNGFAPFLEHIKRQLLKDDGLLDESEEQVEDDDCEMIEVRERVEDIIILDD